MANPPEYKPFRVVAWVLYLGFASFFCGAMLLSTLIGAHDRMGRTPPLSPPGSVSPAVLATCLKELEGLHRELNDKVDDLPSSARPTRSSDEWERWSPSWRERLQATGARCRLTQGDVPGSGDLCIAYDRLNAQHGYYTTLVVQFAEEIGPNSERLQRAMEKARETLGKAP